jgi:ABC-type nitrate/sulfonate/bicarbonate transport system substrate-binding protein
LIGILVVLTVTWAGGIYGLYHNYADVRARLERADVALCRRWVTEHNALRSALIAEGILDDDYPLLDTAECDDLGR